MDSIAFIVQQMFIFSIPLLLVALGGMFSERSGIVNIALEGIMLFGAFISTIVIRVIQINLSESLLESVAFGQLVLFIGLLIAGITGLIFSLLHAYASVNMKANQVISGTALNLFAPAFAIYTARSMALTGDTQKVPFTNQFLIKKVPLLGDIPILGKIFFSHIYITTYLGLVILIISYIFLYKTKIGLRLRSCGENPQAADAAGINVSSIRYLGVMLSGFLGGIGGLIFIISTSTEYNASVAGYGFLALAVLIFGRWKPINILYAALFFGFMNTIASGYSGIPIIKNLPIPSNVYKMVPYIATLIVLAFTAKDSQAPKAAGEIYDVSKR